MKVPYYVRALAMGLPAICFGLTLKAWLFLPHVVETRDFRQLYAAGHTLRIGHGKELYDFSKQKAVQDALVLPQPLALPFNHLAYEAVIFAPLSRLGYSTAYLLWMAANIVSLGVCFRLLRGYTDKLKALWEHLPIALFFGFVPLSVALMHGQDSILILLLATLSFLALKNEKPVLAGLLLGLGLFRFQQVLPIAALFFLWRRWRFTLGFALSSVSCLLVSVWIVGFDGVRQYAGMIRSMSAGLDQVHAVLYGIPVEVMANIRGLLNAVLGPRLAPQALHYIVLFVSVAVLLTVAYAGRNLAFERQFLVAIPTACLVSYHMLAHDLSIMLLPLLLWLAEYAESDSRLAVVSTAFVAPAIGGIYGPWTFLAGLPLAALLIMVLREYNAVPSLMPRPAAAAS